MPFKLLLFSSSPMKNLLRWPIEEPLLEDLKAPRGEHQGQNPFPPGVSGLDACAAPNAADIVKMGYFTGMRVGEIAGLTWDRVNLIEGYINLRPESTKTREPRRVYLVTQALEVLERVRKVRGLAHRYVFTYRGKPIKDIRGGSQDGAGKDWNQGLPLPRPPPYFQHQHEEGRGGKVCYHEANRPQDPLDVPQIFPGGLRRCKRCGV